jgi:hypothetical protein
VRKQSLCDYAASAQRFAATLSSTLDLNDIADSADEGKKSFRSKRELTDRRLFSLAMNLSFDGRSILRSISHSHNHRHHHWIRIAGIVNAQKKTINTHNKKPLSPFLA